MSLTKGSQGDKRQAGFFFFQKTLVIHISPVTGKRVWEKKHHHTCSFTSPSHAPSINANKSVISGACSTLENIYCELFSLRMKE